MVKAKNIESFMKNQAVGLVVQQLGPHANTDFGRAITQFVSESIMGTERAKAQTQDFEKKMIKSRAFSKAFRANTRGPLPNYEAIVKANPLAKATLDVGTLTNFADVTGGQTLGYFSLDTQLARETVRPQSFTLYQALDKTAAYQVVDFWPSANDTGGPAPGGAFSGFTNSESGVLPTSAGIYDMNYITLKLAVNGRAITVALAAQNSYVDVVGQENTNAALSVLESVNWANYWGNATLYTYHFNGIYQTMVENVPNNIFDFQEFYNTTGSPKGWSQEQTLFNMIYDVAAEVTGYKQYGRITHAFMTPNVAGGLQGLVTTLLNNVVNNITDKELRVPGITINGDLQGMRTRFGDIQFPIDLFITVRDVPVQAIDNIYGTSNSLTGAYVPASVSGTVSGSSYPDSGWTTAYTTSGSYTYAAAGADASANESTLVYSGVVSGIPANGAVTLTVTPASGNLAVAFRLFRSGLGYSGSDPKQFRYIGDVAANGTNAVTFIDANGGTLTSRIPGSETVFLLDMDEGDKAIDYRYLLPLSRIELFANNLFMPWAVATIGAIRVRIPKWHGIIRNITLSTLGFDPLTADNSNALG